MESNSTNKLVSVLVRTSPEIKAKLVQLATEKEWTLSHTADFVLRQYFLVLTREGS